jgi:ADP-heptose:LPS heptosyltransferase/GT2 family glycosyltransferase
MIAAGDGDVDVHIDRPLIAGDAAIEVVRGSLIIEGWAVARAGIAAVEITVDDGLPLAAHYGIRRPDVAPLYPDWAGAGTGGFILVLRAGALANGRRRIRVAARGTAGATEEIAFSVLVDQSPAAAGPGILRRNVPRAEIAIADRILSGLRWRPRFGLLLGIGESGEEIAAARRTLKSLRDQAYADWQVTVLRRGRTVPEGLAARLLEGFDDLAGQVALRLDPPPAATLAGLAAAAGPKPPALIGTLLAGDLLGADALLETALASAMHAEAELFYCDERRPNPATGRWEPFFKPQWSPELMLATNYIGRFWCATAGIFVRAGATAGDWARFGDYDLVLRCTEAAADIWRIPELLCERGRPEADHPTHERAALQRAMARRGIAGEVQPGCAAGYHRVRRARAGSALVSIIIPTCASRGLVRTCIDSIRAKTAYRNFEIVCVENIPADDAAAKRWVESNADTVVSIDGPFNWSRFNNLAARQAKGEFLLFLNDDIEIVEPDWLDALIEHAARPEIGAVGARLLYPDRTVQHAGLFWTPQSGRHAFRHLAEDEIGYFGLARTERNVIAVTGACLMVRRDEFAAQGGFDEAHDIVNNDVDYCLRCWERGKRVVYTPHATLIHHEMASRHALDDDFDSAAFAHRWHRRLGVRDGFHHPHLSLRHDDYSYDGEPLELIYSRQPLFDRDEIRNILAIKLDHLGDFILATPALQRLRAAFPQAQIHLLTPPGSAALSGFAPGLASVIEFEFFFARSELGQRELTQDEIVALRDRLAPYRFDLAVDFRKHPETRPILQLSGARWLAGFDHRGRFPWLDIVAEWEQDPAAIRKQAHITDDLVHLADAVADATRPGISLLPLAPDARGDADEPPARRLVCIHPGVGTPIRQWPAAYFAELIDRLAAAHDLDIVLIGNPDEAAIADEVLAAVQQPGAVRSMAGRIPLRELPGFLATAALFVGNNSGPKHIAAGLGVPTIGIESGTVDAREWGPSGANAVAIRRDMLCSPCYLSDPAMCWRGIACLTELRPSEVYEVCARLLAIG